MISETDAIEIAIDFVRKRAGVFIYEYDYCTRKINDNLLSVVFRVMSPEGSLIDGPVVVQVDQISGSASFLNDNADI